MKSVKPRLQGHFCSRNVKDLDDCRIYRRQMVYTANRALLSRDNNFPKVYLQASGHKKRVFAEISMLVNRLNLRW